MSPSVFFIGAIGLSGVTRWVKHPQWYDVKSTADTPSIPVSVMSTRSKFSPAFVFLALISPAVLSAQTAVEESGNNGSMQQHYNDAQELQRAGKVDSAAGQYRAFLADAVGELAMGYGLARDYASADPLFKEALRLDPNSERLLLDYARTALAEGDLDHAKELASGFIHDHSGDDHSGDRVSLAEAHQVLGRTLLKLNRDQEARKELETAVDLDPTFPNGYDLAVACLDLDDDQCAGKIFTEMENSFGDTPELHMAFGRAYGDSDFQPRGVAEFRKAIQENPHLPGAHYLLAAALLETGGDESQVAEAEADLKTELLISPHDSQTYAALGKIEATHNNYPEAETYLKKAISLDQQSPDAYLYLGQLYFDMHRPADAENSLHQCIRLTTDVSRNRYQVQKAHFLLGRILMQKGQRNAAQAEMQIARDLSNKTLAQDRSKLAGLMETADSANASQSATPAAESTPAVSSVDSQAERKVDAMKEQLAGAVADSYNNLGAIAATKSDYAGAVDYFERAAAWNPSLEGLDYNLGRAAFAGSRFTDAVPPLSRYLKAHPDDNGARSVLAISQFMIGAYRDCIATLQPIIGNTDLAPQAEYVYADSLIRTGQIAAATDRLNALEKSHPEIPDVHRAMGEALDRQGKTQQAVDELRTAIRLSPNDAESHYELGKLELDGGNTSAAIPELEAAVRLSPDNESFHQELAHAYIAAMRPADAQREMETLNTLRAHAPSSASPR